MWRDFAKRKALAKTVSWRGMSFFVTTLGVWTITGRLSLAASVGVLEVALKSVGFYLHECAWESVALRGVAKLPFVAWVGIKNGWLAQQSSTIEPEELVR